MGKEKNFENRVKAYLKEKGCWVIKYWGGGQYTKSGIPDLLACVNGTFVAIELKSETGKLSDIQKWTLNQIMLANGISMCLRPSQFNAFKRIVERLMEHKPPSNIYAI